MASIAQKFYDLMGNKRGKLIDDYYRKMQEFYPVSTENITEQLQSNIETEFAKRNIDLKMEFYNLDCQYKMLNFIINKTDYLPFFDLLIVFENLEWLEKLLKEFNFNQQESRVITKLFFKHIIRFYIGDNARNYNMALKTRINAALYYEKGIFSSLGSALKVLQDKTINEETTDYILKREVSSKLNEISKTKGLDEIFYHPELLKQFKLSEEFLKQICFEPKVMEKVSNHSYKENIKLDVGAEKIDEVSEIAETMKSYLINDEPIGLIEGDRLKEFLFIARKIYTPEKVSLLKEKISLNNKKIYNEKRNNILAKIIHEKDRDYYDYLNSIDLTDPHFLPYLSFIQNTIATIEGYISDLIINYDVLLAELYLDEVTSLLDNIKLCVPCIKNK